MGAYPHSLFIRNFPQVTVHLLGCVRPPVKHTCGNPQQLSLLIIALDDGSVIVSFREVRETTPARLHSSGGVCTMAPLDLLKHKIWTACLYTCLLWPYNLALNYSELL